jgi:regulator of replication initiation timing
MENLPNDLEALKEIIRQLLEKNQRLEAENAELCRRLVTNHLAMMDLERKPHHLVYQKNRDLEKEDN